MPWFEDKCCCAELLRPYVAQRLITDSDTRINKAGGLGKASLASVFSVQI